MFLFFFQKNEKKEKKLYCQASELLALYVEEFLAPRWQSKESFFFFFF